MRQINEKKGKDKVAAVLMLCFCVIALTSVFTIKASIDKISGSAPDVPVTKKAPTTAEDKPVEKKADTTDKAKEASTNVPTVDSKDKATNSGTYTTPIDNSNAKISKKYSMNMVIYNVTLDQYMTHPGLDIEAPEGTSVKAIADGIITNIYMDDTYGTTIEITHPNSYISRYCNLATDKLAEIGDTIKQGQVISSVGKTALYESMEPFHLHLELVKKEKTYDPSKFFKF